MYVKFVNLSVSHHHTVCFMLQTAFVMWVLYTVMGGRKIFLS